MPIQVDEVNCRCLRGMETSEGTSRKTCLILHSWGLVLGVLGLSLGHDSYISSF